MNAPETDAKSKSIHRAVVEDAEGLYDVMRTTYPKEALGISRENVRARIEGAAGEDVARRIDRWRETIAAPSRAVFVAKEGARVLGCVAPFFDEAERHFRVGGLNVLPEAQGRGLGQQLIEASIASIGRQDDIYLHVVTYNARTIAFYRRHGFTETGRNMTGSTAGLADGRLTPEVEMVLRAENSSRL